MVALSSMPPTKRRRRWQWQWWAVLLGCLMLHLSHFIVVNGSDTIVQPLLYFTEEPHGTIYGSQNSTVCLNCSAACTVKGAVSVTWRKDGRRIANNTGRYSISNGSLCIENLSESIHRGLYKCLALHQIGTIVSSGVKVDVARISSVSVDPVSITASGGGGGDSIRFQCLVNAIPWPEIEWLKNDQKLITSDNRVTILQSGILQFVNVTKADEGEYKCVARNAWTSESSSSATLSFLPSSNDNSSAAEILLGRPKDQIVMLSHSVVLECFLNGHPLPSVTWTKQGGEIRKDARLFGNGNLEISDVNESDAGIYACTWLSFEDGQNRTVQANVTVLVPPLLNHNRSMKLFTLRRREQVVRLNCLFHGYPVPAISWFKNGKTMMTNNRIKVDRYELSILQARASDEGIYQCRAENSAGVLQASTLLQFEFNENVPFPPVGLVALAVNCTSVQLSWRGPPQNIDRDVKAYSVHIIPPDGLEHQHVVSCRPNSCNLKVEMLQPYTNYTVYVLAYNAHGSSKQSRKLNITTAEDVPVRFPPLTLVSLNSSSIQLTWKELLPDQARGLITEYTIRYQKIGAQKYREISVHPPLTEYMLTGLDPSTKYNVMIAARTKVGYPSSLSSESLPWKTSTTKDINDSESIPDTPEMTVVAVDDTAILVKWTKSLRIQVRGYNLFCQSDRSERTELKEHHVVLNNDVSQHLFSFLEPSTVYRVTLVAFNGYGESKPAIQSVVTSTSSAVVAQVINSTAVLVRWKKPAQTIIYDYTVHYRSVTTALTNNKSVISLTESLIVGDLSPFITYEFTVEARGSQMIRLGTANCQTSEGVPSAPSDLDVTLLGRDSVLVHWNPPVKQNGVVIKYVVLYTMDNDWTNAFWFSKVENGTFLSTVVQDLKLGVIYYFRVEAVTKAGHGPASEIVHISTSAADAAVLTDQELGIIIGTAIGVTCIIICTCIIILHNRCRSRSAAVPIASVEGRLANGNVAHCHHCQSSNYIAEFHVLHSAADDINHFDNGHQLVENSNCDSKGGNMQNRRNPRYAEHNNTVPLLQKENEGRLDAVDLDGIDYDDDPTVTLNNALNNAYRDKTKENEAENIAILGNNDAICVISRSSDL